MQVLHYPAIRNIKKVHITVWEAYSYVPKVISTYLRDDYRRVGLFSATVTEPSFFTDTLVFIVALTVTMAVYWTLATLDLVLATFSLPT